MPLYEPDFGFEFVLTRTQLPPSLFPSGRLDPCQMEFAVRQALTFLVGALLDEDSTSLRTWQSVNSTGTEYVAWGGDFRTQYGVLPDLPQALPDHRLPAPLRDRPAERQLRVRYWAEEELRAPGSANALYLRVQVNIRRDAKHDPVTLTDGQAVARVIADVLSKICSG